MESGEFLDYCVLLMAKIANKKIEKENERMRKHEKLKK